MTYEILHKDQVYTGAVFDVQRIQVALPDQHSRHYDRVVIQAAVTILPMDEAKNIYFVRQYRIGSESTMLELPAGKIEAGEDPATTAAREIREEIGMAARQLTPLGGFYMSPGYSTEYMYCFLATGLYHAPLSPDADEFLNVEIIPLENVTRRIASGELADGKSLALFMRVWEQLKKV